MDDKTKEILDSIMSQGRQITGDVLEEKLQEAYNAGRLKGYEDQVDCTISNIKYNINLEIKKRMRKLQEDNFYCKPSEETKIEMCAYELLLDDLLPNAIREYMGE